jgi:hypothetical protein
MMKRVCRLGRHLVAWAILVPAAAASAYAGDDSFDGNWHFGVTPYLWLPYVDGTVNYNLGRGGSINAQVDPGSYLQNLDFAGMFIGEARKGDWSVFTDYIFLHLSGSNPAVKSVSDPAGNVQVPINLGGSTNVTSNLWTLAGSYTVWRAAPGHLDVFAGTRFLNFDTTLGWNFSTPVGLITPGGKISQTLNKWDAIAGFKGQVRFGETNWFMPYYADIGTGSDNWTWQAILGVGYRFGWGELSLVVRSLSYYFDDDKLDLRLTGPALGATFAF